MVHISTGRSSFSSLESLHVILLLAVFLPGRASDDHEEACPPRAVVDLSNTTKNALGFHNESGPFFPTNKARLLDGIWSGCLCDMIICLEGCESTETINDVRIRVDPDKDVLDSEEPWPFPVQGPCSVYVKELLDAPPRDIVLSPYFLVKEKHEEDKFDLERKGMPLRYKIYVLHNTLLDHKTLCGTPVTFNSKVCFLENDETVDDRTHPLRNLKYFGGLVAVPFLIVTILIYSILPELRNTHGATLRCYLCCLTLVNVTLAINRLSEPDYSAGTMCLCLGFVIYCVSIASFLWLNVICFDLWSKFGDVDFLRGIGIQSDHNKMIWYSIYAWGITFAMTALCVGMELFPGIPESPISPGFKSRACWFKTKGAAALYHFGPISGTIFCNVGFFIATVITMVRYRRKSQNALNSEDSNRLGPGAKSWFRLYTKLAVLMGISWSTETMSWLWEGPTNLWYYTDTVNALHGLLIFIVFVCKKDVWLSLKERGKKWLC